jgi:phage tail-like protein
MGQTAKRQDPVVATYFKIEIDSIEMGTFQKCSGLKSETEIFEYQEGGDNERVHKLVGQSRANNIVLTNGYIVDASLSQWRDEIAAKPNDPIKRRSGAIIALARDGKTQLVRWNFYRAWPVRWEVSDFDSDSGAASCEILELAAERIERAAQ